MTKLSVLLALLSLSATSAFHVPNNQPIIPQQLTNAATTAAIALTTSPLMALAEQDDDYVYGAVAVRILYCCFLKAMMILVHAMKKDESNKKDRERFWRTKSTAICSIMYLKTQHRQNNRLELVFKMSEQICRRTDCRY